MCYYLETTKLQLGEHHFFVHFGLCLAIAEKMKEEKEESGASVSALFFYIYFLI